MVSHLTSVSCDPGQTSTPSSQRSRPGPSSPSEVRPPGPACGPGASPQIRSPQPANPHVSDLGVLPVADRGTSLVHRRAVLAAGRPRRSARPPPPPARDSGAGRVDFTSADAVTASGRPCDGGLPYRTVRQAGTPASPETGRADGVGPGNPVYVATAGAIWPVRPSPGRRHGSKPTSPGAEGPP